MMPPIDVQNEYDELRSFYGEAEALLRQSGDPLFEVQPAVSGWSPAQHLYHLSVANGKSLKAALVLANGKAPSEKGTPNEFGQRVLREGRMPRQQLEAPPSVRPPGEVSREELDASLRRSRKKLDALADHLDDLPALTGRLPHPRIGPLTASQWLRFVRIHSQHHWGIVQEIVAQET